MGRPLAAVPSRPANTVGDRVRTARLARRMSQGELAKQIGVPSHSNISGYETGDVELSLARTKRIAEVLGTTVAALVGEIADPAVGLPGPASPGANRQHLLDVDITDLPERDQIELRGVVRWMASMRRRRHPTGDPPVDLPSDSAGPDPN